MGSTRVTLDLDLSGLEQLKTATKAKAVLLKGIKAGAKLVQVGAKARAPRRPGRGGGALRQSIGIKSIKGTRGKAVVLAVVGARMKVSKMVPGAYGGTRRHVPGYIAHMVELGTRPHAIKAGSKLARRGKDPSTATGQGVVNHPGAKPRPFLRPAFLATRGEAIETARRVIEEEIRKFLEKQAARLAAKAKKGK